MLSVPNELLLDVYACADQPQRWRPVLDALCPALGVRSAIVQILDEDGLMLRERWCARDSFSTIHATLHDSHVNNDQNPRMNLRLASPVGKDVIMHDRDTFTPGCREYEELLNRLSMVGLGEGVGLSFALGKGRHFALMAHRAHGDVRSFSGEEEAFLRCLAPHFQQMLRLAAATEDAGIARAAGEAVLDNLRVGVIICDLDRQVKWSNRAARQVLSRSPCIEERHGYLRCRDKADNRQFASLFGLSGPAAGAVGRRSSLALGKDEIDAVHILAFPLAPDDRPMPVRCDVRGRMVLLVSEPRKGAVICPGEIADLLNLSPAEAALTAALCGGHSLQEYADRRGISVGTARIQLKSVLAKTNTHRQTDLVRQICGSVLGYGLSANSSLFGLHH